MDAGPAVGIALRKYAKGLDTQAKTGLPDGTFLNAGDFYGLVDLTRAREAMPGGMPAAVPAGMTNTGILPPQLQRRAPNFPMPQMLGRFGNLAYQMAGAAPTQGGSQLQQPLPGMKIPTPPINPMGIPMTDPMQILRGRYGQ